MKIECLIRREGGSFVGVGGVEYHFAPQPDGRHVAEVEDDKSIAILLAITEGYRAAEFPQPEAKGVDVAPKRVMRHGKGK